MFIRIALFVAAAGCALAQVSAGAGSPSESLRSIFDSGLAGSLLQADTPASPVVNAGGSASGFGGVSTFASGSWLEIKGTGLAFTTQEWQGGDFNGLNAPTSLAGVRVSVNGKPGFIYYIKPTDQFGPSQVNVQAPDDDSVGPIGITVTNAGGTSNSFIAQKTKVAAGMLAPSSFNIGGKQYLVGTFGLQYLFVGNPNLIPGAPFQPAKPGDSVWVYGIGFGETDPALPAGVIATAADRIKAQVSILFGQTPATVTYAGHYPNYVGLYLFIVTVPNVADGDQQIHVLVDGQEIQQTLYLTVKR